MIVILVVLVFLVSNDTTVAQETDEKRMYVHNLGEGFHLILNNAAAIAIAVEVC